MISRRIGVVANSAIRRCDRSVGISFEDGSAARVHADVVLLEQTGTAQVSVVRKFARAFAHAKQWLDNTDGAAWPFPRPQAPGMPLAGAGAALRKRSMARLRRYRIVCVDEDPRRQNDVSALWENYLGAGFDVSRHADAVVVLSPPCIQTLSEPGSEALKKIEALVEHEPQTVIASFPTDEPVPRFLSFQHLAELARSSAPDDERNAETPDHAVEP